MSLLDDLFSDLQEDLQKVEQEEQTLPPQASIAGGDSVRTTTTTAKEQVTRTVSPEPVVSAAPSTQQQQPISKKPKLMMPAQLQQKKKEVVVVAASAAPSSQTRSSSNLQDIARRPPAPPVSSSFVFAGATRPLPATTTAPPPAVKTQPKGELVFQAGPPPAASPSVSVKTLAEEAQEKETQWRLFVGNLGAEVRDDHLQKAFKDYPSVTMVRVIMESKDKCKGYGFVYFADPFEMLRAMREKEGKLCGVRPMLIRKGKPQDGGNDKSRKQH